MWTLTSAAVVLVMLPTLEEQTGEDPGSPAAQLRTSGGPGIESPYYALLFRHLASACRRRNLGLLFSPRC